MSGLPAGVRPGFEAKLKIIGFSMNYEVLTRRLIARSPTTV
jgi:hypothetical protein